MEQISSLLQCCLFAHTMQKYNFSQLFIFIVMLLTIKTIVILFENCFCQCHNEVGTSEEHP